MTHETNNLANAIDNYNHAYKAMNHCPPDRQDRFDKIADAQHAKFCKALERVGGGHE